MTEYGIFSDTEMPADEALAYLTSVYPEMVTHEDDEGRILVWECEADAENDDGSRAVATVYRESAA